MLLNEMVYAGIEISSGSHPFIYAAIDKDLNIRLLEKYRLSKLMAQLQRHANMMLSINASFRNSSASAGNKAKAFKILEKEIVQEGFRPYLSNYACRQWVETYPLDCFTSLSGQTPLPRSTRRGRVQRAKILYEQGLQINAPITRSEFYTALELDALMAAGIAWMLINRPVNIDLTLPIDRQMITIPRDENSNGERNRL